MARSNPPTSPDRLAWGVHDKEQDHVIVDVSVWTRIDHVLSIIKRVDWTPR